MNVRVNKRAHLVLKQHLRKFHIYRIIYVQNREIPIFSLRSAAGFILAVPKKPINVSKHGGQIQLALLTNAKNN